MVFGDESAHIVSISARGGNWPWSLLLPGFHVGTVVARLGSLNQGSKMQDCFWLCKHVSAVRVLAEQHQTLPPSCHCQVHELLAQLQDLLRRAETERDRAQQQLRAQMVRLRERAHSGEGSGSNTPSCGLTPTTGASSSTVSAMTARSHFGHPVLESEGSGASAVSVDTVGGAQASGTRFPVASSPAHGQGSNKPADRRQSGQQEQQPQHHLRQRHRGGSGGGRSGAAHNAPPQTSRLRDGSAVPTKPSGKPGGSHPEGWSSWQVLALALAVALLLSVPAAIVGGRSMGVRSGLEQQEALKAEVARLVALLAGRSASPGQEVRGLASASR